MMPRRRGRVRVRVRVMAGFRVKYTQIKRDYGRWLRVQIRVRARVGGNDGRPGVRKRKG